MYFFYKHFVNIMIVVWNQPLRGTRRHVQIPPILGLLLKPTLRYTFLFFILLQENSSKFFGSHCLILQRKRNWVFHKWTYLESYPRNGDLTVTRPSIMVLFRFLPQSKLCAWYSTWLFSFEPYKNSIMQLSIHYLVIGMMIYL